jgi:hypothetical protein
MKREIACALGEKSLYPALIMSSELSVEMAFKIFKSRFLAGEFIGFHCGRIF